ncbi:fumarate hydratase [Sporomusa malonica]|uniref:Fumarase, class I alpha subunit n=1 Tax=Sporomusa malonica TaxID=112901 RepID=A0A1W1ZSD9_9FIRM|nr:fumarate hydratase [Sporomusa malonica]SMC51142.1 fumarase, class I alpha subunit [Sporomusa malonica]
MRTIQAQQITDAVAKLAIDANYYLSEDVFNALIEGKEKEESPLGKEIFDQIIKNACIARDEAKPMCQDTGLAVIFVELGQDVSIEGSTLETAINAGVAKGYTEGYLRKSAVAEPLFNRKNTGDNTPAIIHIENVPGDQIKIVLAPKGAGSENKSALKMLVPADGVAGVKKFIVETIENAGSNPCPPMVVGVGIGGTMEKSAYLAKKALIRPITKQNDHPDYAKLEGELLELINKTGIGPQGLGGRVTALAVNIEWYPTHIASLPVAVNINCHATRHAEVVL